MKAQPYETMIKESRNEPETRDFRQLKYILNDLKVEYSRILMFGSRARGDFREESDWDFLIIMKYI